MSVYICKLYTDYSRCQFRNRSLNPQTVTPPMREIPMRKCFNTSANQDMLYPFVGSKQNEKFVKTTCRQFYFQIGHRPVMSWENICRCCLV